MSYRQTIALAALVAALLPLHAQAQGRDANHFNDVEEEKPWQESGYKLPPFPEDKNLAEFYVNATANAKYYVDKTTIDAGHNDNVVRYAMVVKSAGGATNISYEGLRCGENELRVYATGRADGSWNETRNSQWRPLKPLNRHQYALARYYFCPVGVAIWTAQEGRDALRLGSNPRAPRYETDSQ